jgi:ABC-type dipeptide/oligopeptide/nickel transport system permease subunit
MSIRTSTSSPRWALRLTSRRPHEPFDLGLAIAALAFLTLLTIALFGARFAPHEPIYFVVEHGSDPRPYEPGIVFPFGSDVLGRDLLALVLAGARSTLEIALLAGIARVCAGVAVAAIGGWWRPLGLFTEWLAELVSAVPATIVALVIVKVLVKADTTILVFISALLLMGWAGPYRVIRAELDRLAVAPFTQGARTIGVGRWRMFWRHHVPHLAPVLAVNLSQQIVASLVLVAELGVLGTFVGTSRTISIEESLSRLVTGPVNAARIADPPEWGGLLATARTIESLWTTRWLVFVPGVAFALTALAVGLIGFAIARRYARRDLVSDLRGPGAAACALGVAVLVLTSALLPERFAEARGWADDARAAVHAPSDIPAAFASAGLVPVGSSFAVTREATSLVRAGKARLSIDGRTLEETREDNHPLDSWNVMPFVSSSTGGGVAQAPLVYAGRGISQSDTPAILSTTLYAGRLPDLGTLIENYPDDYAGIDVHGKIVLLVRFVGVATKPTTSRTIANVNGPAVDEQVANAIKRGAAGVIFVDPALRLYTDGPDQYTYALNGVPGGPNPYFKLEHDSPATTTGGVPVVVVSPTAAQPLLSPFGIELKPFVDFDQLYEYSATASPARDLGVSARLEVPLEKRTAVSTSYIGEVAGVSADAPRILVWVPRKPADHRSADVAAALARSLAERRVPFVLVDYDDFLDRAGTIALIHDTLGARRLSLVLVVERLDGSALRFTTPYGDLIPMIDLYAEEAGARHEVTRDTATLGQLAERAPFIDVKTIVLTGNGGDGDLRPDAAALIGYLAGRLSLGAEELPR